MYHKSSLEELTVMAGKQPVKKKVKSTEKKSAEVIAPKLKAAAKAEPEVKAAPAAKTEVNAQLKEAVKPEVKAEPNETRAKKKAEPAVKKAAEPETDKEPKVKKEAKKQPAAKKPAEKKAEEKKKEKTEVKEEAPAMPEPRRSVAFIGSECFPFVKTGGLGDVMYALPKALIPLNCDVRVILPRYKCIPQKYQEMMYYRGAFEMDLCSDGKSYYVGIMELVMDGVVHDFIDNDEFFSWGNPYTDLVTDIPKFCYFSKAALAALNFLDWIPDIVHCHDWQAALVPVFLKTQFGGTPIGWSKSILTIHNLRFQGIYNIKTIQYWTNFPDYVFDYGALKMGVEDANMLKGGLAYADAITTVSNTYAGEIQTEFFGENLDAHLRYHSWKLRGIVNGIDVDIWNSRTDKLLAATYDVTDVDTRKTENKLALQEALGLEKDPDKMVIGLISRLTNQKGLDLVNMIFPALLDGNTQVVILGTGDAQYEDSFRYYESVNKGTVCAYISYNEALAHQIYAGADALLVPSLFEPCGLTQLIAMRYGTVPIVRETGGLKDTVQPYNEFTNEGNGFTFDRYEAGLLLDAVNRAKTVYFTSRDRWDEMVKRNLEKDVSWGNSAAQYRNLYLDLRP